MTISYKSLPTREFLILDELFKDLNLNTESNIKLETMLAVGLVNRKINLLTEALMSGDDSVKLNTILNKLKEVGY